MKTNKTFAYGLFAVILALSVIACDNGNNDTHTHDYGTAWKSNATQHWHECSCGAKTDIANHSGDPCAICGYASGSQNPDPCECNGNAEDCECEDCDCETCEEETPDLCECNGIAEDCDCDDCDCETCEEEIVISSYTVTFDADNGTTATTQTVTEGDTATKPADPAKNGYGFVYWFNTATDTEWDFNTIITADITLKAKWTAIVTYTVTFNADNGNEPITQTIAEGSTVTEPSTFPIKINDIEGLYAGTPPDYTFVEWRKDGETAAFIFSTPITTNITLKAHWAVPSAIPIDISSTSGATIVEQAFAYTNANPTTAYTLLLGNNVTVGTLELSTSGANLTLIGIGKEQVIQYNGESQSYYGWIFDIGTHSSGNVSLTLGANITLKGVADETDPLVVVSVGILTMLEGSKITGHTSNNGTVRMTSASSVLYMNGGEISGNHSNLNGVVIVANGGELIMNDGRIIGNTIGTNKEPGDVYVASTSINLSNNANIGTITLNTSGTTYPTITIARGYNGGLTTLNLRGSDSNINTVIGYWENNIIITAETGYSLTTADIAKFILGDFICAGTDDPQKISETHKLADFGSDIGKLVGK